MPEPALAGMCPYDQQAVTFHLDAKNDDGLGAVTGLAGDIYHGRCERCFRVLTRVAGPIVTTVGGKPSEVQELRAHLDLRDAAAAVNSGTYTGEHAELIEHVGKLTPEDQAYLLEMVKARAAVSTENTDEEDEQADASNGTHSGWDSSGLRTIEDPLAEGETGNGQLATAPQNDSTIEPWQQAEPYYGVTPPAV